MAGFYTHVSSGIGLGIVLLALSAAFTLLPTQFSVYAIIGFSALIGSIVPDIDSDTSLPFHITFFILSTTIALVVGLIVFQIDATNYRAIFGYALLSFLFVWIVIGYIFKRFTRHRGMAHSIPAALLAGLIAFSFASRTSFGQWESFVLGITLFLGYLSHLILDEIYAGINFNGRLFVQNKAFGSALKLFSKNRGISLFVYLLCIGVICANLDQFNSLAIYIGQTPL